MSEAFQDEEHQDFRWDGGSTAALLIHGYPGTPAEVRPIAEILHDEGWTVRGILLPGFGTDIATMAERTHDDWLNATRDALHELRQTHEHVYVVGYSMGGAIAMTLAEQEPVDGLVLFSPFTEIKHILWHALPAIRIFVPKIKIFKLFKPDFSDSQVREGIQTFMPDADLDDPDVQEQIVNYELPIAMFNEIRTIGQKGTQASQHISVPTLIFQGREDDLVHAETTQKLARQMSNLIAYIEVDAPHDIIDKTLPAWEIIKSRLQSFVRETVQ
ncbi:MAG: alpha/beta fold hydrolase [Chloroflexota bacterium]